MPSAIFELILLCGATVMIVCQNRDPCGGSLPVPGTDGGIKGSVDIATALENIARSANESALLAHTLITKYTTTRVSQRLVASVSGRLLTNFPYNREDITNVTASLQKDYDEVSTISVFMGEVIARERIANSALNYTTDMLNFQVALGATLCKIKIAADARNQEIVYNVTREVMPDNYRNITCLGCRYVNLDYIIFRDAESYLNSMSAAY